MTQSWIGVDLDGTLAHYTKWIDNHNIGEPIPQMVARVQAWIRDGFQVKIMTARHEPEALVKIESWCLEHIGLVLPITNQKDMHMVELWDDRAIRVIANTGLAAHNLNSFAQIVHKANHKWWTHIDTGERIERNVGELISLMHSELSEMLEAHRKNMMDSHLPHRKGIEVELADLLIRAFDFAGGLGLDLDGAYLEKMAYNETRADHSHEERRKANGKKI